MKGEGAPMPTWPMSTERTVMTLRAAMEPVKEMSRDVFIASSPVVWCVDRCIRIDEEMSWTPRHATHARTHRR